MHGLPFIQLFKLDGEYIMTHPLYIGVHGLGFIHIFVLDIDMWFQMFFTCEAMFTIRTYMRADVAVGNLVPREAAPPGSGKTAERTLEVALLLWSPYWLQIFVNSSACSKCKRHNLSTKTKKSIFLQIGKYTEKCSVVYCSDASFGNSYITIWYIIFYI